MKPPFRADQVGSLLRPKELAEARARYRKNEISSGELKVLEDKCIKQAVEKQEAVGLQSVTGKVGCPRPIMVEDFSFLKKTTAKTAKFTMHTCRGNALSMDEQWRKLERVVEVAREVWK